MADMTTTRQRLPHINLARYEARHLVYHYDVPRSDPEAQAWSALLEDKRFLAAATYSQRKNPHSIIVQASDLRPDSDDRGLFVRVTYNLEKDNDVSEQRSIPKKYRRIADAENVFANVSLHRRLTCHVDFRVENPNIEDIVFPLPLPFPTLAGASEDDVPFDEIRGIRAVKRTAEEPVYKYRFILDRPSNRDIHLTLDAHIETMVSLDTPMTVLDYSKSIKSLLGL